MVVFQSHRDLDDGASCYWNGTDSGNFINIIEYEFDSLTINFLKSNPSPIFQFNSSIFNTIFSTEKMSKKLIFTIERKRTRQIHRTLPSASIAVLVDTSPKRNKRASKFPSEFISILNIIDSSSAKN